MCGIAGIVRIDGAPADASLVRQMTSRLAHRGPDGDGFFVEGAVGLGHRRLSIIDVEGGAQPISNEDQTVHATFNGEIYNFRELRKQLESSGHRFRTSSDSEILVHAWEQWGTECVHRLRGMFAFAIWDKNRECLFLARDRLGIKPLHYTLLDDGLLVFASELKAITHHAQVPCEIDDEAVEGDGFGDV